MLKELGNEISIGEKKKIKEDFQDTLLAFRETVILNGARRGGEWNSADIFNSERTEGDHGSCSVNLVSGVFHDQNPDANPRSGGAHAMFCAIFGLKGAAGWRAMRRWNEDRTLPDGQVGAATGRKVAKLSEGSHIEAGDKYEQSRVKWIRTFARRPATIWCWCSPRKMLRGRDAAPVNGIHRHRLNGSKRTE